MQKIISFFIILGIASLYGETISSYNDSKIKEFSSINSKTITIEKEAIVDLYKQALTYYKQKNYQKAYTLFNELFSKNLNDVNINFYLGRSGYELGLFDEAILAFDRILFENPETLRVQFELGKTYIAKENYLDAKKYFQNIIANGTTPNDLKVASQKYLAFIDGKISNHTIGGVLIFGINYDSNIHNSSKNDIFSNVYIPAFNTYVDMNNSTQKEGGIAHQEIAVLNHTYQLNDTMQIKTDGMLLGKFMFEDDLKEKNIKMGSITSSFLMQHTKHLSIAYGLFLDNLYVGGENYIQSYGLFPKLNFIQDEKRIIDGYLKYQKKYYQQKINTYKNSTYSELGGTYKFIYNDKFTLIPNILFSKEDGSNNTAIGVDNTSFGIGFGVNIAQSSQLFLLPACNYKITKYEDVDISYLQKQEDKELNLKLGITYLYSPLWILQGDIGYVNQSSNIAPNEYKKYNFGINFIRAF